MDLQLHGKRALVTGSSSGIGEAVARCLAAEGAHVVVHGRDEARTAKVASDIVDSGGTATFITGDLSTEAGTDKVAQGVFDSLGGLDILVNNAGGSEDPSRTWATTKWNAFIEDFELNTGSAFRMIEHFLPGMKQQGWGRIIQVTSSSATMPFAHTSPSYNTVKAGLITMTVSLSKTVAGHGITVNCITPGSVDTAVYRKFVTKLPPFVGMSIEEIEKILVKKWQIPVGRMGKPEELGDAITFLASPLASFVTGANIRVDGGMSGFINA